MKFWTICHKDDTWSGKELAEVLNKTIHAISGCQLFYVSEEEAIAANPKLETEGRMITILLTTSDDVTD